MVKKGYNKVMKIKMLNTVKMLGVYPYPTLYKGKTYKAAVATNQPNYKEKGLVFAVTAKGFDFLIGKGDYKVA